MKIMRAQAILLLASVAISGSLLFAGAVRSEGGGQTPCNDWGCEGKPWGSSWIAPLWLDHPNIHWRCSKPGLAALTFDDGPLQDMTAGVLDELKKLGVPGTFFVNGNTWAFDLMKRAYQEGHQIASHTYSHRSLKGLGNGNEAVYVAEIDRLEKEVNEALGGEGMTRYLRPPYLDMDQDAATNLQKRGWVVVQISIDTNDWKSSATTDNMVKAFTEHIGDPSKNSYISLQHDTKKKTQAVIAPAVRALQQAGYRIVRIDECLGDATPPPTAPTAPTTAPPTPPPTAPTTAPPTEVPTDLPRCGTSWTDANSRCGTACPSRTDDECTNGERCFADMNKKCGGGGGGSPTAAPPTPSSGSKTSKWTYYWMKFQQPSNEPKNTALKTCQGKTIATVPRDFAEKVRMEGSGYLLDGTLVNLGGCDCSGGFACFMEVDTKKSPWGLGAWTGTESLSLDPYVSIASNDHALGTTLYVPALDGVSLPDIQGGKNAKHDGCVRVDDVSWSFGSDHLDFFAARKENYEELIRKVGSTGSVTFEQKACTPKRYAVNPPSADGGKTSPPTEAKTTAPPTSPPTEAKKTAPPTSPPTEAKKTAPPTSKPTETCADIGKKKKCKKSPLQCGWSKGRCSAKQSTPPPTGCSQHKNKKKCKRLGKNVGCAWRKVAGKRRKSCILATL